MSDDPMANVYPSIDEILTEPIRRRLNPMIIEEIKERYAKHGPEYISELKMPDGRLVNQCILNDSAQDAIEEIVDAVFNVIILSMKAKDIRRILRFLMEAYDELVKMKVKPA